MGGMGEKPLMQCGHAANARNSKTGGPSCAICIGIHSGAEKIAEKPSLDGRRAMCSCDKEPVQSAWGMPFFEYRGEGSPSATESCRCGYYRRAHEPEGVKGNVDPRTVVEKGKCSGFTPRGAQDFDLYYCGCRGWD